MENYEVIFESENICYIKQSDKLLNEYLKMYCDEEIQKKLFKKKFTYDEILDWIKKRLLTNNKYVFSMIEKSTNEYIGNIEIVCKNEKVGEIIISIVSNKQNKHFGTEAIKTAIKYGYEIIGLEEYDLYVYKNNLGAIRCYEKAGFKIDGEGLTNKDVHMTKKAI